MDVLIIIISHTNNTRSNAGKTKRKTRQRKLSIFFLIIINFIYYKQQLD